jgi:hypothetical protein
MPARARGIPYRYTYIKICSYELQIGHSSFENLYVSEVEIIVLVLLVMSL